MNKYYVILLVRPSGTDHLNPRAEAVYREYDQAQFICTRWNQWADRTLPVGYYYIVVEVEHDD